MPLRSLPALSRGAIAVASVAAAAAVIAGFIGNTMDKRTRAMAKASQQCQEDLKTQIAQLQDYLAARKAEQGAGEAQTAAALDQKMRAIEAFKSRC